MSIQAMSLVWQRSRSKGSNFTMLLAIADHAKDDGRGAWPSVRTLTWKTRLTGRAGEIILARLVVDGEVEPEWSATDERLYLHVRCVCAWSAYQGEGAIPEPDPERKKTRENFARKLQALYANRQTANVQPGNTVSERGDTVSEQSRNSEAASLTDPSEPSEPSREPRASATPEALQALWNAVTAPPIIRALALSPRRRAHALARLQERTLTEWDAVFARVAASAFCRGHNDRAWLASFGWVISSPDVSLKVLEGQYDDRRVSRPQARPAPALGASGWMCPHDPRCPPGTTAFNCDRRTTLGRVPA